MTENDDEKRFKTELEFQTQRPIAQLMGRAAALWSTDLSMSQEWFGEMSDNLRESLLDTTVKNVRTGMKRIIPGLANNRDKSSVEGKKQ